MSKRLVTAALVFVILVASITANALPVNALPATSDLTKRSYYFLNDQHLTARFGNTAVCGDHLCGPGEFARLQQSLNDQQRFALEHTNQTSNQNMSENTMPPTTPPTTIPESMPQSTSMPAWITKASTVTSVQDPGQGHESHQLALILPPSDKAYHGVLTYSASEPVQLVTLIGPIDPNDKKGQLVYTMDGNTWYALVFVDSGMQMGTWEFSGNALAVHTTNTTPFQVSYTVDAHN